MEPNVYLDNNATTRISQRVLDTMMPYLTDKFGNPSTLYYLGQEAKEAIESSRQKIVDVIGCSNKEIFFTSGATESDNWILRGIYNYNRLRNKKSHIIISSIEHHAVLNTCKVLEKEGLEVTFLSVDKFGKVSIEDLKKSIKNETVLVSIMASNNETGIIEPIEDIGNFLCDYNKTREKNGLDKIYFHSDVVQAFGKILIDVNKFNIDSMSFSGHKIYGPKGIGALYLKQGTRIYPFMTGGGQEFFKRAGTENVASIVGLGEAMSFFNKKTISDLNNKYSFMREKLWNGLKEKIRDVYLNTDFQNSVSNTLNVSFKNVEGEGIVLLLNKKGVSVSSGSACTSGSLDISHVLKAMGVNSVLAQGSIRFSFGKYNKEEDVDYVLEVLPPIVEKLRSMSPLYK